MLNNIFVNRYLVRSDIQVYTQTCLFTYLLIYVYVSFEEKTELFLYNYFIWIITVEPIAISVIVILFSTDYGGKKLYDPSQSKLLL